MKWNTEEKVWKTVIISCCQRGKRNQKKRRKEEKEEKKGRKRREKRRKGEKKGRKRKGKEGKREYTDSVGDCVGRFFFQSPEVVHKLGCQPEFVATGDFTTAAARVRGSRRLHRTSARVFDSWRLRKTRKTIFFEVFFLQNLKIPKKQFNAQL